MTAPQISIQMSRPRAQEFVATHSEFYRRKGITLHIRSHGTLYSVGRTLTPEDYDTPTMSDSRRTGAHFNPTMSVVQYHREFCQNNIWEVA